jgi:hypothetical protein
LVVDVRAECVVERELPTSGSLLRQPSGRIEFLESSVGFGVA